MVRGHAELSGLRQLAPSADTGIFWAGLSEAGVVVVQCPGCRHENPDEARFCAHCGVRLGAVCTGCGTVLPPEARFCSGCGRTVATRPAPANYTPRHISEQILPVRSAVEGERKQVSVLFCDIVRSGQLAAELGPEEFHAVIDRFFGLALGEVHRYGGTINQFLGDGFMALFGAPLAHEDHARRAVLAALGIMDRAEVAVRIGINSGLVVVGAIGDDLRVDYTAFGDTTVLAARLQVAAAPGAVLVSERTAGLVRGYFQLENVPPVQVKDRTVAPLRVTGLGTRTAPIVDADELSPFTGRQSELAELCRLLDAVAAGAGQVAGLAGDPGLGKSRLAWEFRRLAEPRAAMLMGRCLSYGAGIAYLPLFDLVRAASGIAADEPPDRVAAGIDLKVKALELDISLAHYLRHAFGLPGPDSGLGELDPHAMRARTFDALRQLLIAEATYRPLVVLVEDLHWIDQTSQDFLAEFADELPSAPILLLAAYRPGYTPPWTGRSFTTQISLRPLSPADSNLIVGSILTNMDARTAVAIAGRGEGNPFFLEELARAARDQPPGASDVAVPHTVQQVLAARIDRLTADQKAAIQLAAVLGREFSLALAEEVWGMDVPLAPRMQELKRLEFLRERHGLAERTFLFTHALTREVAYDSILQARRRELHGQVGAALERPGASRHFEHAELLGYHYARSTNPERAIPYLVAAGDRASGKYANEEAIIFYRQAIGLIEKLDGADQPGDYRAACEGLGDVLRRLSRYDAAVEVYRKPLAVTRDRFQRARLHLLCSEAEENAHRYENALAQCDLAEQALGRAPDQPGPQWLSSWADIQSWRMAVLYWLGDTEEYARLIEQIRPVIERHGSAEQRTRFLVDTLGCALRRERYQPSDETLELARAADAAARQAEPSPYWWAVFELGFVLLWHGDLDEATPVLRAALTEAEQRGDAATRSRALTYLMVADRLRGDVKAVCDALGPVIERARDASLPEYEAMALANRAWVAWRNGDEQQAAADALAALEMWEGLPVRYIFDWMARWPLAAMALASGRVGEAAEHARGMLPPPQMLLPEPVRTAVENAVGAWDAGEPAATERRLRQAVHLASEAGYL